MSAELRVCPSCFGTGWTKAPIGAEPLLEQCGKCGGIGQVPAAPASPANTAEATGERALPGFIRREIEQAIEAAEHPKGMSLHDGKAHVLASSLRCMLTLIDARTRPALTDEQIVSLWDAHLVPVFGKNGINPIVFARAIERHLNGEKP
jgi:hypothetical protein